MDRPMSAAPTPLADLVPEPIVALGVAGRPPRGNAAWERLAAELGDAAAALGSPADGELVALGARRFEVERWSSPDGGAVLRLRPDGPAASRARAVERFLDRLAAGRPPLRAAAAALWQGARWRWTFVTRFDPRMLEQVQVLHWLEDGRWRRPFDYPIEGTPCELVFGDAVSGCRHFSDLPRRFPGDAWSRRVGAREYVGQVYRTRRGVPLGHLFSVSDREAVGREEAKAVVALLSQLVAVQLQALSWSELVDQATERAHRDPLTGLASRRAFDQAIDLLSSGERSRSAGDVTLIWMDLDGLKRVNDTLGHAEGDRLLITFAHHLASEVRARDSLFRVGGDEFVLVVERGFEPRSLERRLRRITATLHEHGFADASVSWGAARPAEAGGDVRAALRLADRRMYAMKRGRGDGGQSPSGR